MDTNPLSMDPELIISNHLDDFELGISAIRLLSDTPVHLCIKKDSSLTFKQEENTHEHVFYGPHPSGLVGTHMHFISPASVDNINWHISYSDVILIGSFFREGKIPTSKYICLIWSKV